MRHTMTRSGLSVAEAVVESVAAETDTDALSLPPLAETLDPDALNALVEGLEDGRVAFRYAGCDVTVESDGTVQATSRISVEDQEETSQTGGVSD